MSDENVEREKAWSEFVSNNGLTYAAEQQLRVAFIGGWVRGRASRPREAGSGAVEKQARLDANAAAYALCNGERGAVPSRFQFDIEQTLVPYFIEARARSATAQGDDLADRIFTQAKDPASPLSKALWGPPPVPPADEDAPKCEGCDSPATTMDGDGVDLCEPCAKAITPPVAPEACPRCGGEGPWRGKVDARVVGGIEYAKVCDAPCHATHASATAEGGGGDTKRAADGGTPAALSHPGLLGQSRLGSSDHTTEPLWVERDGKRVWSEGWQANRGVPYTPGMLDTLRFYAKDHFDRVQAYNDDPKRVGPEKCPESVWVMADRLLAAFPATPASAAGREGAREAFTKAALEWARWETPKDRSKIIGQARRDVLIAYDALLAAEAAERGEEEA